MSRIEQTFKKLKRPALKIFVSAGDPDYGRSLAILRGIADAGADMIELGMPFSDPVADGPTVEAGGFRALGSGASMKETFRLLKDFRQTHKDTPIILMGYANPVHAYDYEAFARDAADAGADGALIVDLPPEESGELETHLKPNNIDLIRLITPTTDDTRLQALLKGASGFLYYVSITGITGTAKPDIEKIRPHITRIKEQTGLPVAVGFGIRTAEDVRRMASIADAVVVGSSLVQTIADHQADYELPQIVARQVSELASGLSSPS